MPRILQLRDLDGAVWAKLDLKNTDSPVRLYTEKEVKQLIQDTKFDMLNAIAGLVNNQDLFDKALNDALTR